MRARGAVTYAQDEASSTVYGMPREAARIGAAAFILPPAQIAGRIAELLAASGARR
jgi:two-component system chemotaxis response regulator CheB